MILEHDGSRYRVGSEPVARTPVYRLYVCTDVETNREYLLQVATGLTGSSKLDRMAYILRRLKTASDELEILYAKSNPEGRRLDYDRLFPGVVQSFVSKDQGDRRINIVSLKEVEHVTDMVPLSNLTTRDGVRVELPSSAWIMGRLLKLLGLTHGEGIAARTLSGNNVLINPEHHFVVVLDWCEAYVQDEVSKQDRTNDIAAAARSVFTAIGGDTQTGEYPYDAGDHKQYVDFIWRLCGGRQSSAERAHTQFYELVTEQFGRKFLPFQVLPL